MSGESKVKLKIYPIANTSIQGQMQSWRWEIRKDMRSY